MTERGQDSSERKMRVQWENPEPGIHPVDRMSAARKLEPTVEPTRPPAGLSPATPAALFKSHFEFAWRNLKRMGVAAEQLEDAAQDVFTTVHRRWESYDPSASSIETWVFGIMLRVASHHRRTLRRRLARLVPWFQERGSSEPSSNADDPAEIVAKRQAAELLDRILEELRDYQREILVLVDVEQISVPEAAQLLGINLNTAYTRLRTARLRFQGAVKRQRANERRRVGGREP